MVYPLLLPGDISDRIPQERRLLALRRTTIYSLIPFLSKVRQHFSVDFQSTLTAMIFTHQFRLKDCFLQG